jgi:EAL domain-containing protein (putative c-di-GMP-specific phosphodiesterase class I)/GGDEF domain-containing protein
MDAVVVSQEQPLADAGTEPDTEPLLLALLAGGGAVAAWSTGAHRGSWSASIAVAVLAASAWLSRRGPGAGDPRRTSLGSPGPQRLARAVMTLAAAAVAVGASPGPAPLALAWLPAVCAVYALVLPPRNAAGVTLGALAVLAVLAAAVGAGGSRPPTAYAACAVCLIAASLAAGTMRAVRDSRADLTPAHVAPHQHADDTTLATGPRDDGPDLEPAATPAPVTASPAGVPGTDALLAATARAQERSGVVGGRVGLLVVTLQGLAELPAAVGRGAAQAALDALARRARAWLPAGDVVAWLGNGRLGVLLEGVDAQTCLVVGRRLAALLAEPVEAGPSVLTLPASLAVTLADDVREAPETLLGRALAAPALSASDLLSVPPPTPDAAHDPLLDELWPALGTSGVRIALQPIVALGTLARHDRVVAVEALARWTRSDGVAVPPARFVTAARRAGLADLLGATVLTQGLDALVRRREAGAENLGLAVNVAPEQLGGPAVADGVLQAVAARGLDARALTVELPAGAPLDDPASIHTLRALREAGVGIVLDNFGATGLSLAALRDLPLSGIKLDRSLVADLGADDRLVVATLRLATRLGLTCTAVGVETPAQLEAARALGIDAAQGHLLGRPEGDPAPASGLAQPLAAASPAAAEDLLSPA